jgi:hypothetical protein
MAVNVCKISEIFNKPRTRSHIVTESMITSDMLALRLRVVLTILSFILLTEKISVQRHYNITKALKFLIHLNINRKQEIVNGKVVPVLN